MEAKKDDINRGRTQIDADLLAGAGPVKKTLATDPHGSTQTKGFRPLRGKEIVKMKKGRFTSSRNET